MKTYDNLNRCEDELGLAAATKLGPSFFLENVQKNLLGSRSATVDNNSNDET